MTKMRLMDASPFVRHVQLLHIRAGEYPALRRAYDCRLFYVYRGEGRMILGDAAHEIARGDLFIWQPDTAYRMETTGAMQFLCINFDYTLGWAERSYPIPPDRLDDFDEAALTGITRFWDVEGFNTPVFLRGMQSIEEELLEMKREYLARRIFWREWLGGMLGTVLARVARTLQATGAEGTPLEARLEELISYIQAHCDQPLSNAELGRLFNYHPNYLNRQMQLYTGKTLHQYLLSFRISRAIEYLETSDMPIAEVAHLSGFPDLCHFSKLFRQKTGNSPSFFRRPR